MMPGNAIDLALGAGIIIKKNVVFTKGMKNT